MDKFKKQLFMLLTGIWLRLSFKFNKYVDIVLYYISRTVQDSAIIPIGPYSNSMPLDINLVMIDGRNMTNRFTLMTKWKWDFEIGGITKDTIELIKDNPRHVVIHCINNSGHFKNKLMEYHINLNTNIISCKNIGVKRALKSKTKEILFSDIVLP
jgi:hypothetical protein